MGNIHSAISKRATNGEVRRALQEALHVAVTAGELEAAREISARLRAAAPKSNGRSSSSVYRDPYAPELLGIYARKLVHEILAEYGKEIRLDFGFLGVVVGLANIVIGASSAVGEPMSESLCRELVRRLFIKMHERNHGMGMLYTERANQVLRKMYEHPEVVTALGLPNDRPWVKRKPLGNIDGDFGRRWEEYVAGQVDTEGQEPEDGEAFGEVKTTEQVGANAKQNLTARDTNTETPEPSAPQPAEALSQPKTTNGAPEEPTEAPSHPEAASAADKGRESQENTEEAAADSAESEVELQTVASVTEREADTLDAEPDVAKAPEEQTETVNTDSVTTVPDSTDDSQPKPDTMMPNDTYDSEPDAAPLAPRSALNFNDLLE
ncbi:MAG: hypothetical protein ABI488_05765 [Polyangiaceae bacterium]